jgi:small GTP-binding protein
MEENTLPTIKFFVSGQVDSGKSTLIGYLLHKTMNLKFDNESNENTKYSDLLDVDRSERERGITQFSSNNLFIYKNHKFEAIDTPGHLLYIRELINSISSNKGSIGCLIISSVVSEFMSMFTNGTTKEDAILMRCCGVNHVIILINKIDKLNAEPEKVKDLFVNWITSLGFKSITFVSISGFNGLNIFERIKEDSPCFIETLIEVNSKIKRNVNLDKALYKTKIVKLKFHSFDINSIIVVGYKSVFHVVEHKDLNEIEGEIININKNKKNVPFFRGNEDSILHVQLDLEIEVFENQRFILRDSMRTIGFGFTFI